MHSVPIRRENVRSKECLVNVKTPSTVPQSVVISLAIIPLHHLML